MNDRPTAIAGAQAAPPSHVLAGGASPFFSKKIPVIGFLLSLALATAAAYWEYQASDREFTAIANGSRSALNEELRRYTDALTKLRSHIDAAGRVLTYRQFTTTARQLFQDPSVAGYQWVPLVRTGDRANFERQIAAEIAMPDFRIHPLAPDTPPPKGQDEYYPIAYTTAPDPGREYLLGADMASDQALRLTLEKARDADVAVASPIFELFANAPDPYGFFLFMPVYQPGQPHDKLDDRRRTLAGFVQVAVRVAGFFNSALHSALAPEHIDLFVFPADANRGALPIDIISSRLRTAPARPQPRAALQAQRHWTQELSVANTAMIIIAVPYWGELIWLHYLGAPLILVVGLVLTMTVQSFAAARRRTTLALTESRLGLDAVFNAAPDGIALVESGSKRFRMVNESFCRMLSFSEDELLKRSFADIHPEHDLLNILQSIERDAAQGRTSLIELPLVKKDGHIVTVQLSASVVTLGGIRCYMGVYRDITDRKAAEIALRSAHDKSIALVGVLQTREREAALLAKFNDVLQACETPEETYPLIESYGENLFPDTMGALAFVTGSAHELDTAAHWGSSVMAPSFRFEDCWALRTGRVYEFVAGSTDVPCRHLIVSPDGSYMCLPLVVHGQVMGLLHLSAATKQIFDDNVRRLLIAFGDAAKLSISNLRMRQGLRESALRDSLTGLFNRRYLEETLARELHRALRAKSDTCVAMLDIDHFKRYNDENGHDAGNEVLKAVAKALSNAIRGGDIAARIGGEEFILVLEAANSATALPRVTQICQAIKSRQVVYGGKILPVITMSAGIAEAPEHGMTVSELLSAADRALYAAKNSGRDRVVLFSSLTPEARALEGAETGGQGEAEVKADVPLAPE